MNDKMKFQEMLLNLMKYIEESKKEVTDEDVQEYLAPMNLAKEQVDMVLEYVNTKQEERKLTKEEEEYLEEYLEILSFIKPEQVGERKRLIEALAQGKEDAKNRLVEVYLPKIVPIAKELKVPGVLLEDLIQEGNLGLTLGIYEFMDSLNESTLQKVLGQLEKLDEYLDIKVKNVIHAYIEENTEYKRKDNQVMHKVMELDECLTRLEKKLGRKVMIDELAEEMKLEEAEVLDILKLAGESLDNSEE